MSHVRALRKHEQIWLSIKDKGKARIRCHPYNWPTVKKAVIKEKNEDVTFKFINDHDEFRLKITYDPVKQEATFVLKQKYGLEGVKKC